MKQFQIYENPHGNFAAVKVGFCWPGFFFGVIWALFAKLWKIAAVVVMASMFISVLGEATRTAGAKEVMDLVSSLFGFAIMLWFGFKGNELRGANLLTRGYEVKGSTISDNKDGAIAKYVKAQKADTVPAQISD